MCLLIFAYKTHPKYPLILISNRDEFYKRPTAQAAWWKDQPEILGGRDLEMGGTWLGIRKNGLFAILTNYRHFPPARKYTKSRGELVCNFLKSDQKPQAYAKSLNAKTKDYDGYNMVFGTLEELCYYSNINNEIKILNPGVYGLSNHLLNTQWPKVVTAHKKFNAILQNSRILPSDLFDIMSDTSIAPDNKLPSTGVGMELERLLSPAFIQSPDYGTRCTSLILIDQDNKVSFEEHSYVPNGNSSFKFKIEGNK